MPRPEKAPPMTEAPEGPRPRIDVTLKISLAGDPAVGKTSLVRRFVSNTFDDRYISTLGTRIASRRFAVDDPRRPGTSLEVGLAVWDIMGSHNFRTLLKEAFFAGANAVLLVCDRTYPGSFYNLPDWYNAVASVAGLIPAIVLLNKSDLQSPASLTTAEVDRACKDLGWTCLATSAKTGENVDLAFRQAAEACLRNARPASAMAPPSD